jgi:stage II sporulation protein AA (anti-sigma F factor antagonist)
MEIAEARLDGVVLVAPTGRIDTTTAPALEQHLMALLSGGERRLVVDFAGVGYISSAGLRIMLLLARRMQDVKGRLALCGMGDAVRLVFQLAGFLPLFTVRDSREASVTAIGGS